MPKILGLNFINQGMMRKVLIALTPLIISSVYFFGWRSIVLLVVVTISGVLTEYVFRKKVNKPISEAIFVSCVLYTLTLPPRTPYWIAAVGIIFGIIFAKEVFGGFGELLMAMLLLIKIIPKFLASILYLILKRLDWEAEYQNHGLKSSSVA